MPSKEQFYAYERVRMHGKYNMLTEMNWASREAGLDLETYLSIQMNYDELWKKYHSYLIKKAGEVIKKNYDSPTFKKELKKPRIKKFYEPDLVDNCGYKQITYAIQQRIPTLINSRNWKTVVSGIGDKDDAIRIMSEKDSWDGVNGRYKLGPRHYYRLIVVRTTAEVIYDNR